MADENSNKEHYLAAQLINFELKNEIKRLSAEVLRLQNVESVQSHTIKIQSSLKEDRDMYKLENDRLLRSNYLLEKDLEHFKKRVKNIASTITNKSLRDDVLNILNGD